MIMYYVYILKSVGKDRYYIGQTKDLTTRLKYHNSGYVKSTKRYKKWKLIYKEKYHTRKEVIKREKYLKSHAGRNWIKKSIIIK